jgi:hypothetical protein
MPQKARQLELPFWKEGEALRTERSGEASSAAKGDGRSGTETNWGVPRLGT